MSLTDIDQIVSVLMDSVSVLIIGDSKHKKNITIANCCVLPLSRKSKKYIVLLGMILCHIYTIIAHPNVVIKHIIKINNNPTENLPQLS